ncbi:MAG: TolB family protein [Bryobacteraceae bacterium]
MISVLRAMLLCGAAVSLLPAEPVGVRILLGLTDKDPVRWDGAVTARGAKITAIEPWRFETEDSLGAGNTWKMSTRAIRLFGAAQALQPRPVVANGLVVWVDQADGAELDIKTAQGNFTARLAEIPYGKRITALNGRAMVDRVPPVTRLTSNADEQDYPAAAAGKGGAVWVAYLEFKHHPDHNRLRANFAEAPANFDAMKTAPGGDQILVKRFASGAWSEPIAITEPGGDLYRPAIAVDSSGRAWVFWSANQNGNFDLWARAVSNGQPGAPVRITKEAGSDIDPVAATDSSGRVWVAWQGWRNGRAAIFAAAQRGD